MKTIFLLFTFLIAHSIYAQVTLPLVQGIAPNNYMVHQVQPKENWFSVGRLYNINAKELASYNKLTVDKGLAIAQILKVPIVTSNKFDAKLPLATGEAAIPIYHIVEKSEGLYRIAINNGATMEQIRLWNNLSSDVLSTGTRLKVGYIKVKEAESAFASIKETPIAAVPQPKETVPAPPKPPVVDETPPIIKDVTPKEEPKKVEPKKETVVVKDNAPKPTKEDASEGYFKGEFGKIGKQGKNTEGKAATFKTMAGWDDDKYYVLVDGITPGTIVQVKSKTTGKSAYAKVLGEMQELKQNHGLLVRISNATANAIGENEEVFDIVVNY